MDVDVTLIMLMSVLIKSLRQSWFLRLCIFAMQRHECFGFRRPRWTLLLVLRLMI